MAFTEKQEYKIEILPNGTLQVRRADIVLKDDVEIGRQYHRHVLNPGADVSAEVTRVKNVASAVWTAEVVSAYEASLPDPDPQPDPTPDPDPANLIPDNWSQDQRLAAMQELLDEYNANR